MKTLAMRWLRNCDSVAWFSHSLKRSASAPKARSTSGMSMPRKTGGSTMTSHQRQSELASK